MNLKKLLLMLTFFVLLGTTAFAQVYVDVTNGSDTYTGANPTNNPAGTGPKASITAGLAALPNNGTLYIYAGNYTGATNDVDIKTATYAALTGGLTIRLRPLNANTNVNIDNALNAFIFNVTGGTLNIVSEGAVLNTLDAAVTLSAGSVNLDAAASWVLANNTTITINGTAAFTNVAPTKGTNVNVSYTGGSSITAGPEAGYGNFGAVSTLTVNKTAATSVTFNSAITVNDLTVTSGIANLGANITVKNLITNNTANSKIQLNTYQILLNTTVAGPYAHNTNLGTITASTGGAINITSDQVHTFNGGTLSNVIVNKAAATVTFGGAATSLTDLTVSDGTVNVGVATTAAGKVLVSGGTLNVGNFTLQALNFEQNGGTFTLAANAASILNIKKDFSRTAGTFTAGAASKVQFTGTVAQVVNGGPLWTVADLTFNNTAAVITVGNSVRATGAVNIAASTNVDLSTLNIILFANSASIVNDGIYTVTAGSGGGVIFGGVNTVAGAAANYTGQLIGGTGTYSYITVDVGTANTVTTDATGDVVKFSGVLNLVSGDLAVAVGDELTPVGASASIIRDVIKSAAGISAPPARFNATTPVDFDLTWNGTLAANKTINTTTSTEFDAAHVRNLTVNASGGGFAVVLAGGAARTIKGNLVITGNSTAANAANLTGDAGSLTVNGDVSVGQNSDLTLGAANMTVGGTLTVAKDATINTGNAANTITLSGNTKTHTITGSITAVSILTVTGTPVTINGVSTSGTYSELTNLTVAASKNVTVSNIQKIGGAVTTNASSSLTLGLAAPDAGDGVVVGAVTLGGSTFAITSAIEAQAGVAHNKGTFDFGANNFTCTTAGNFTRAADASAVYTGTGTLVLNFAGLVFDLNDAPIANVEVKAATTFSTAAVGGNVATFTGTFTHTAGAITLTNDYTLSGNAIEKVNSYAGAGKVTVTGVASTITASGVNVTYPGAFVVNSTGTLTLASNNTTTRTFTVPGAFTQTAGNIDITINKLVLTGASGSFSRGASAGTWAMDATKGLLEFNFAGPGNFNPGTGFAVDNLKITAAAANSTANVWTVNKYLTLAAPLQTATAAADNKIAIGNGATIERQAAAAIFDKLPTFNGTVNLKYTTGAGPYTVAKEMPTTDILTNLTVSNPGGVQLNASQFITVNGTLSLGTLLDVTTAAPDGKVTMAVNSTLELLANSAVVLDANLVKLGAMNLVYNGATATGAYELGAISGSAYTFNGNIKFVGVAGVPAVVLTAATNFNYSGTMTFDGGDFDLNGNTINLNGSVATTANGGTIKSTPAGAKIAFTGSTDGTFTNGTTFVVPANVNIEINKTNATNTVTLGSNLDFATNSMVLALTKGIFVTGTNKIYLKHDMNAGTLQPTQGYTRTAGHVYGTISKNLNILDNAATTYNEGQIRLTRVEYPVGDATNYRPMAFQFNTLPSANLNLSVQNVPSNPAGTNGFPITDGSITLASYPGFFWLVSSDLTLQPQVKYDIEAEAYGYAPTNYPEGVQNVRFLRRFDTDVNNPWVLQGGLGYDNSTNVDHAKIIVRSAEGAISTQGARFTYSQAAKAPVIATASAAVTVAENAALSVVWTATSQNLGGTATFDATPVWTPSAPAGAIFTAATGTLAWTPSYTQAGTYTVKVKAVDGTLSTENTVTITVTNANQAPSFTATGAAVLADATIPYGTAKTFTYVAKDADNEALTYAVNVAPVPAGTVSISNAFGSIGLFSFTPTFADNGKVFVVTVTATDPNAGVATTTANLTIGAAYKRGDANTNGVIDVDDAIAVLKFKVNPVANPLTAEQQTYANAFGFDGVSTDVTTYDAAFILRYLDSGISEATRTWPVSKVVATAGTVEFGKLSNVEGKMVLPFTLANTSGVNSIFAEADLGSSNVDVKAVQSRLPQDWYVVTSIENGKVRIAAAGLSALKEGTFASIELTLSNKEAVVSVNGNALLNDDVNASLNAKVREIPSEFALSQNYPNPFNPTTSIKFSVAQDAKVNLVVYDMLGQRVRTLVDGIQEAGFYTVRWDGSNDFGSKVASGIYIYRLQAGSFVSTMKMNLMK